MTNKYSFKTVYNVNGEECAKTTHSSFYFTIREIINIIAPTTAKIIRHPV
jgi:2-keto-4-pentenoate hydratase/2-oxohepta-3-ene-1,7-dioic acid hydratase in catechol pathway